jgi:ketosteroid isomerase-like protein
MAEKPSEIFARQIRYICDDDRQSQLGLFAPELIFEFPFAVDRPRKINGVGQFAEVMMPLWEKARQSGVKVTGYRGEVFEVADHPELIFAEFTLTIDVEGKTYDMDFVQKMRVVDGKIIFVREYSGAALPSPLKNQNLAEADQ